MSRNELYHFGVPGMKWGVRRYQNADGSLTSAGKKRYGHLQKSNDKHEYIKKGSNSERRTYEKITNARGQNVKKLASKAANEIENTKEYKDWQDVLSKRGKINQNGQRTLSYFDKEYSLDELLETMMSDSNIQSAYEAKTKEILDNYKDRAIDASLLDAGYKATKEGREYVHYLMDKYG